jgi:MoxR-like ATPase
MEERQITLDGVTRAMPRPFLVMATQNPVEYEGTFPLPESQLDRFMMRVHLGYPSLEAEDGMLQSQQIRHPISDITQVVTAEELQDMQERVRQVHVDGSLREYMIRIVHATRDQGRVYLGASPRGSLALFKAAQALAALEGRDHILPDDVKQVAVPALSHRIIARADRTKGRGAQDVVREILQTVPVPV